MPFHRSNLALRPCVRFWWCDSSPQGGTDWFISRLDFITIDELRDAYAAHRTLADSGADLQQLLHKFASSESNKVEGDTDMDDHAEKLQTLRNLLAIRQSCSDCLKRRIVCHTQLPMGIGSKAGSLEDKLRALVLLVI